MRVIITEEQSEKLNHKIKSMVEKYGVEYTLEFFGDKGMIIRAYQDNPSEFLEQFNDLIPKEISDKIFYLDKDGNYLFFYNPYKVYIDYDRIWKFFEEILELKYKETEEIIKNWLEETYNIRGLTPNRHY